jgi:uncharacterized protein (TIGR00369 family)
MDKSMEITQKVLDQLNDNSLYHAFGLRVEEAGEGAARSRLVPETEVCWPFPGQPHGGVLFTLMDTTMAWAVFSEVAPEHNCATISLDIQYTLPAKGRLFTCSARVIHRTGRTSFARADIRDAEDRIVALGQGTFRIIETDIMREEFDTY